MADVGQHSLPALTGLRGLAALWVLVYHAWVYAVPQAILLPLPGEDLRLHVFFSLGWSGVHVLFVLSGFLLTLPYARYNLGLGPRPVVGSYLRKRIARVFPAYYLQLFVLVALGFYLTGELLFGWDQLIQYLLMLFVPPPVGVGSPYLLNGVWWTLPIELSFYLVLPVLSVLAAPRRLWLLLVFCFAASVGWRYFVVASVGGAGATPMMSYQLPGSLDTFGLGMAGAVLHVYFVELRDSLVYRRALGVLVWFTPFLFFGLGSWMAAQYMVYWEGALIHYLWTPLFGLGVMVLLLTCARGMRLLDALLANRALFFLGTVSYGVYLWHYPVGRWLLDSALFRDYEGYSFYWLTAAMLAASLVLASVSWYGVERRAINAARSRKVSVSNNETNSQHE